MPGPLFLGLDLSTQQLKAVLISEKNEIVHESAVHFDSDLPQHGTSSGRILGPREGEVTSPVAMWLDALELLMKRMKGAGVAFGEIAAISGAGQQHGSVYWSATAENALSKMDPAKSLSEALSPHAFSLQKAPIWQDSSTGRECRDLEAALGGAQTLADLSGSRAYERFTGPQIAKLRRADPATYAATSRISLVSSFIPSVFLGLIAPIEISDASGMNLMDVVSCKWDDRLLEFCGGPELRKKLGPEPVAGGTNLGKIGSWWVARWGFNSECIIAPFTGDNPATVVALSAPGDALLSLGTSTTFLLSTPPAQTPPSRFTTSHLLTHPTSPPTAFVVMLCYQNGALARESVRDQHNAGDWAKFNQDVESTQPGNGGHLGLYFPLPEIIPPGVVGNFYYEVDPVKGTAVAVKDLPKRAHSRAILESQLLSIRSRIAAILPSNSPPLHRLVVAGGASGNPVIRQLAADVFGMRVYVSGTKEGAGMGGAMLARWAWWRAKNGDSGSFEDMTGGDVGELKCVGEPNPEVSKVYDGLVQVYRICEEDAVKQTKIGTE